jgi:hypothetical protein
VRAHYVKANVKVHAYPDGTLAVFHRPRRLAVTGRRSWHAASSPIASPRLDGGEPSSGWAISHSIGRD